MLQRPLLAAYRQEKKDVRHAKIIQAIPFAASILLVSAVG